jgi:hypothetical protein
MRKIPIKCPECGTSTRLPYDEAGETLEEHNENQHNGERVAGVAVAGGVMPFPDDLADDINESIDGGIEELKEVIQGGGN